MNRTKTFLDKVTVLDIAYSFLVYKNTKEVWEEDLQIKASSKDDKGGCHATHHKKKEGEGISKGLVMGGQTMGKIITKNCSGSLRISSQVMSRKHYKIIGNCIRRNIMQEVIIKMRT